MLNTGPSQYGEGDYLLVVSGSTYYAPYLKGWQEFKDHLRKIVREQPGWAEVLASQNQRQGERQGWCRLKYGGDAEAAYKVYYKSKGILVHIWETCRGSEGFRLLKCNCSSRFEDVPEGGHSEGRCGIDIERVIQLSGKVRVASTTQHPPAQSGYSCPVYPQTPAYSGAPVYPAQPHPISAYSMSTNSLPVNLSSGVVLTEARGIFIRNLNFKTTPEEFAYLLNTVGRPVDYKYLRDARTGGFKGVATATFASTSEAQDAATKLNGCTYMGMTLAVRMDADVTPVGRSTPMIVNGSTTYPVRKTRTISIISNSKQY